MVCEICGSNSLSELFPMEMMYGKSGPFRYVRCHDCESIYQPERLSDYGQYYPKSYYSFQYREPDSLSGHLRQLKRRYRNAYYYFSKGFIGRLLALARPRPVNHLSNHVKLRRDMSILEVGSGTGELLHEIADLGIKRVVGIDPFVPETITYKNGARVLKAGIHELGQHIDGEKFDLIMFNHALEHSPTPAEDLASIAKFLKRDGEILLRLPVSGSEIANTYGKYWWSLDSPRHIYLFSTKSMPLVAAKCAMSIKRIHFEGTIDDFLASEQHKAGIPLLAQNSYVVSKDFSAFSQAQLAAYEAAIALQNKNGTAALAGFVLTFSDARP
jgi:2-polyprenyl-3-methyl-5-hydroxy-6-metoxy-1,4-benzoquinol methylase